MPTAEQRRRGLRRRRRRTGVLVLLLALAVGGCAVVLWPRDDGLTREEEAAQRACLGYGDLREDGDELYGGEFDNALRLIREDAVRSGSPALLDATGRLDAALRFPPVDRRGVREAIVAMDGACRAEGVDVSVRRPAAGAAG